jgi:hypothetical protein
MTKLYRVTNPAGISAEFRRMAKNAFDASQRQSITKLEQACNKREFVIWEQAANMIDNTEFVGWAIEKPAYTSPGELFDKPAPGKIMNAPAGAFIPPLAHLTDEQQLAVRRADIMHGAEPRCDCGYLFEICSHPRCSNS